MTCIVAILPPNEIRKKRINIELSIALQCEIISFALFAIL